MTHHLLAERFRPSSWADFVGQEKILSKEHILRSSIVKNAPMNLLLWGPPGTGKTSAARIYIRSFDKPWHDMHPSTFSAQKIKEVLQAAESSPLFRPTIFWIDEIHRLTTPQQDLLLKAMEDGSLVVIGATTENPSFCLRPALLSRMHAISFETLSDEALLLLLERLLTSLPSLSIEEKAKRILCSLASGDARKLLSFIDLLFMHPVQNKVLNVSDIEQIVSKNSFGGLSSSGEGRYLLISALHKAVRGSDCDASLYWFTRLLEAGEDPLYIARRMIRMATEDIGLADPHALIMANNAFQAYKTLGSPEGDLALAEVVLYLALSPKSASCYLALGEAREKAKETRNVMPPHHIINAPTKWMQREGFGEGYIWEHDCENALSTQSFWPDSVEPSAFYQPVKRGFERTLQERLAYFKKMRQQKV